VRGKLAIKGPGRSRTFSFCKTGSFLKGRSSVRRKLKIPCILNRENDCPNRLNFAEKARSPLIENGTILERKVSLGVTYSLLLYSGSSAISIQLLLVMPMVTLKKSLWL